MRIARSRLSCVGTVVACLGVAAASSAADWSGREVTEDGIRRVLNPETAMEPDVTVRLERLWSVGGDDEDVLFGVLARLVEDEHGNIYALDSQLSEIQVFSPDGEWLRTIGREGEGPGEFRNGSDLYRGPQGRLGVVQIFPGRVVLLTPEGDPAGNLPLPKVEGGGFQLVHRVRGAGDHIVMAFAQQFTEGNQQIQVSMLRAFDIDGNEVARYHEESTPTQFGGMKFNEKTFANYERRWAVAADGRVAAALDFDAYRIHVWNADGTLQRVIERRDWQPLERTGAQKKRFQKFFDGITRWSPGRTFEISDTHATIQQLQFRDDGSLWVQSSRGAWDVDDGVFVGLDVYDAGGRFVQQVHFEADHDPVDDGWFLLRDRVYVVTDLFNARMANLGGDEDEEAVIDAEPVSIVAYRLDAPALVRK